MRPADAEAALRSAREASRTLAPFTDDDPTLDEEWGYEVQALDRRQRVVLVSDLTTSSHCPSHTVLHR